MGVEFVDRGWLRILSDVSRADSLRVKAGVIGEKATRIHTADNHKSPLSIGQIAIINEYGTDDGHIPPRPFLQNTAYKSEFRERIQRAAAHAARMVVMARVPAQIALRQIGNAAVEAIRKTITDGSGVPPPNAPATVARKGSDHTLIDSREMLDAVSFEVTEAGLEE